MSYYSAEQEKFNKSYCRRNVRAISRELNNSQFEFIKNKISDLFKKKQIDVDDARLINIVENQGTIKNEVNNFLEYVYEYFDGAKLNEFVGNLKLSSLELTEHEEECCFEKTRGFYYDNCDNIKKSHTSLTKTRYVAYKTLSGENKKVKDIVTYRIPDSRIILEKGNDFVENRAYFKYLTKTKKKKKSKLDKVLV